MSKPTPVVLCILDGWGLREDLSDNAPALDATPTFDRIMAECPNSTLVTHGSDVGLPSGQMGNSEVGHTNIGAGRVVAMDLGQIDLAIEDGSFARRTALQDFITVLNHTGGRAHLAGLVSAGGVHSHQAHMAQAARILADAGIETVVHVITDGRDVPPRSAHECIVNLREAIPSCVEVATVSGRYFAMDRDNRWNRVERAFRAIVKGEGVASETALAAVDDAHAEGITDEFIPPAVLAGYAGMNDGDGVFFTNFRADRAREIMAAIAAPGFDAFRAGPRPNLAACLGMVEYSNEHNAYMTSVFPKQDIRNTLGAWVARHGLRQFRLAETEKYPHVTFFLNGGKEEPEAGEELARIALDDLARIQHNLVDRALLLLLVGDQRVVAVEKEHAKVLGLLVAQLGRAVIQHRLPRADDRPALHRLLQRAHAQRLDELERVDHRVAHAVDFLQRLLLGAEHAADGAEAVQQALGQRLGVASGYRAEQQKLEQLVVGQAVGARLVEALAQPLAVAVVVGLLRHRQES